MSLQIRTEPLTSFITLVRLKGDADVATAHLLPERITPLFEEGITHLVVDLDELQFIDSSGLRELLILKNQAKKREGELSLVCSTPHTRKLLRLIGFDKLFKLHYNQVQALWDFAHDALELICPGKGSSLPAMHEVST